MQQRVDDWELLREYAQTGSGQAFSRLVSRHVDMVYSASLRQVSDPGLAEDVTQAVFIVLARKAARLPRDTVIAAWLHKTSRYTALNALKSRNRRQRHEREAAQMNAEIRPHSSTWHSFAPLLDEGLSRLSDMDRAAIVLRFFQHQSLADVGRALQMSEGAAQMRVSRAIEKLRAFFARRGTVVPAIAIGGVISVSAVHAAPAGLAPTIGAKAQAAHGAAGSGSPAGVSVEDPADLTVDEIADATERSLTWSQIRRATAFSLAAALALFLLAAGLRQAMLPRPPASQPVPEHSAASERPPTAALHPWR